MVMTAVKFSVKAFLDLILPRLCPACQNKLSSEEDVLCASCFKSLRAVSEKKLKSEYKKKFTYDGFVSDLISLYNFEKDKPIQYLIHTAKYGRRFHNAYFLGKLLGNNIKEKCIEWNIGLIIPVPLHHLKKAERGYNQAYYIAKGVGKITGLPVDRESVRRTRVTKSQTFLSLTERQVNVRGAFKLRYIKNIEGKNVLLVDDVITSGSTISECAKVLKSAGAEKVYAASAALA